MLFDIQRRFFSLKCLRNCVYRSECRHRCGQTVNTLVSWPILYLLTHTLTHTYTGWNVVECRPVCVCVFVFPAIVRRRLIPPLVTDRRLSKLPEIIIKGNNSNSHTLLARLSVCLSFCTVLCHPASGTDCLFSYDQKFYVYQVVESIPVDTNCLYHKQKEM